MGKYNLYVVGGMAAVVFCTIVMAKTLMKNDEDAIRKAIARASSILRKDPDESGLTMAMKCDSLGRLAADTVSIEVSKAGVAGEMSGAEAAALAARMRAFFNSMSLDFKDVEIKLEKQAAKVSCAVAFSGTTSSGEKLSDFRKISMEMVKKDGAWLFKTCRDVETLRK